MKKINTKILVLVSVLAVVLLVFTLTAWRGGDPSALVAWVGKTNTVVSPDVASSRVINYIDETYIQGATTINLVETVKESGVYRITLEVGGERADVFATLDGKFFFGEGINLENIKNRPVFERTIGRFNKINGDICLEDGKPIIYYFGTSECPFCLWQHPVMLEAMKSFEGYVSFKDHTDTENDRDVFFRYSEGGVPLIVAGCRYFRVGAGGSEGDEESDRDIISAITCKLTGGQPAEVCGRLEEIINQI